MSRCDTSTCQSFRLAFNQLLILVSHVVYKVFRIELFTKLILQQCIQTRVPSAMPVHFVSQPLLDFGKLALFNVDVKVWNIYFAVVCQLGGGSGTNQVGGKVPYG